MNFLTTFLINNENENIIIKNEFFNNIIKRITKMKT